MLGNGRRGNQLGLSHTVPLTMDTKLILNSPDTIALKNTDDMIMQLKYEQLDMRVYNIYGLTRRMTRYATAYYRKQKALGSDMYLLSCIELNTDITVKGIGIFGVDWVSHRSIDEFSEIMKNLILYQAQCVDMNRFCYVDDINELDRVQIGLGDNVNINYPCYVQTEYQVNVGQVGNAQRQQQIIIHIKKSDYDDKMYSQDGNELDVTIDYTIVRKPLTQGRYKYRISCVQLNQDMIHLVD